jgi:hypothetical protein
MVVAAVVVLLLLLLLRLLPPAVAEVDAAGAVSSTIVCKNPPHGRCAAFATIAGAERRLKRNGCEGARHRLGLKYT